MTRRVFLGTAASAGLAATMQSVVDTHIHLFDPRRPQGVPWPPKTNELLYKPALPDRYRALAAPHGVVGAIMVECSPWLEDNQWVLDTIAHAPIILGMVGNLEPADPDFPKQFERFHRNPLFLGIRYGNLWGRDLRAQLQKPAFLSGLRILAAAGLTLDTANQSPALLEDAVHITDKIADLRIVIDHLPQMAAPAPPTLLKELSQRKNIFVKISEVPRKTASGIPEEVSFYKPRLDELCGVFGDDRVLFGSDWPNSENWLPYDRTFRIVREYFDSRGPEAAQKYFFANSRTAYRWVKRA